MKRGLLKKFSLISMILCLCAGLIMPMISGCTSSSEATAPPVMDVEEPITKSWTIMVYMATDCSDAQNYVEESDALRDIIQMEQAGSNDSVAILVQWDNGGKKMTQYKGCRRVLVTRNVRSDYSQTFEPTTDTKIMSPVLEEMGNVDTGDPDNLQNFIEWGIEKYPANKYAVIFFGHGSGWRYDPNVQKSSNQTVSRDICFDETSGSSLTPTEIKRVFDNIHKTVGERMELVAYNNCLAGMIEEAYNYIGTAKYFVASERSMLVYFDLPYYYFMNNLRENPSLSGRELAINIAYYFDYVNEQVGIKEATLAVVDTSKLSALTSAISDFATSAISRIDTQGNNMKLANSSTAPVDENYEDYKDISLLMTNMASNLSDSTLITEANNVKRAVEEAVIYSSIGEDVPANTAGLSIWIPDSNLYSTFESNYSGLPFVLNSTWNDFLQVFIVQ